MIRGAALARRLGRDTSGLALVEFALALPMTLTMMMYAVEMTNLGLTNLRVDQAAINLADNASRVGIDSSLSTQQLRELDINDVLQATRLQTKGWNMTERARITLSSLEDSNGTQRIHWQRCMGKKSGAGWDSPAPYTTTTSAGTDATPANAGTVVTGGMGDPGRKVYAPPNSGVMYVEINYQYKPLVGTLWLPAGAEKIRYTQACVVRDRRDFTQIFNPSPAAPRATCDKYTA